MSEWISTKLGNILTLKRGYDLPNKCRKRGSIPVVSSSGVSDFHAEYKVKAPGVVTGRYGTIGEVFYIAEDFWPLNTTLYVEDFKGNDPLFISYFLQCVDFQAYAAKSAVPGVNRNDLHLADVRIPDVFTQKQLAYILSSYDNLITNNNRRIAILEEMAQKLYREWFVHFRFPGHENVKMVESERGLIPEGWSLQPISTVGQVVGGGTPSTKNAMYFTTQGIPWLCPRDFSKEEVKYISKGNIDITEAGYKASGAKIMPTGTVVFSSRAPIGYTAIAMNPLCTNQGFKSIIPNEGVSSEFIYYYLKNNLSLIDGYASGATFKEISSSQMKLVPVLVPNSSIMMRFDIIASSIGKQMYNLQLKNANLRKTRDLLLPRLISGDIDVSDLNIPIKEG